MRIFFLTAFLELSRIVPIFKSGDNTNLKNHRPISVLNFIAKSFEKLIHRRLNSFIAKHNIICNEQFRFRQRLNTTDAVVEYLDHVYKTINTGSKIVTIFLDFSQAFDTVNIYIL